MTFYADSLVLKYVNRPVRNAVEVRQATDRPELRNEAGHGPRLSVGT